MRLVLRHIRMAHRLQDGLSFCEVDGHVIFLDTRNDRYFRLSGGMDRAFRAHIESGRVSEVDLGALVEHDILAKSTTADASGFTMRMDHPVLSAMEQPTGSGKVGIGLVLDVFSIVGSIRLQLSRQRLDRILAATIAYRDSRESPLPGISTKEELSRIRQSAAAFWRVRPYVPIEPLCLLDSLAMVRFLAKRGLRANLVFGVTDNPFSAHAWAQAMDVVLTDSVGNVAAHTPIRVV